MRAGCRPDDQTLRHGRSGALKVSLACTGGDGWHHQRSPVNPATNGRITMDAYGVHHRDRAKVPHLPRSTRIDVSRLASVTRSLALVVACAIVAALSAAPALAAPATDAP